MNERKHGYDDCSKHIVEFVVIPNLQKLFHKMYISLLISKSWICTWQIYQKGSTNILNFYPANCIDTKLNACEGENIPNSVY